jgi:hypothetical protein
MTAKFRDINSMMGANSMVQEFVKASCLKIQHLEGVSNFEDLKKMLLHLIS